MGVDDVLNNMFDASVSCSEHPTNSKSAESVPVSQGIDGMIRADVKNMLDASVDFSQRLTIFREARRAAASRAAASREIGDIIRAGVENLQGAGVGCSQRITNLKEARRSAASRVIDIVYRTGR